MVFCTFSSSVKKQKSEREHDLVDTTTCQHLLPERLKPHPLHDYWLNHSQLALMVASIHPLEHLILPDGKALIVFEVLLCPQRCSEHCCCSSVHLMAVYRFQFHRAAPVSSQEKRCCLQG